MAKFGKSSELFNKGRQGAFSLKKIRKRKNQYLVVVDADEEEEGSVPPVHHLVVPVLHERTLQIARIIQTTSSRGRERTPKNLHRSRSKNRRLPFPAPPTHQSGAQDSALGNIGSKKPRRNRRGDRELGGLNQNLLVGAGEALADDLALEGAALVDGEVLVVLGQPRLPLLVHEQHEPDPHRLSSLLPSSLCSKAASSSTSRHSALSLFLLSCV